MKKLITALLAAMPLLAQNATVLRVKPSSAGIGEVRWYDADESNYVGLKSAATVGTSLIWTLPSADASGCLTSNGSLVLSIGPCSAGAYDYTPTAYSNTTWEHALHVSVNGADSQTIIQAIQGGSQYTADGIDVAHDCPASSTNWECGALSGVLLNGSTGTNAVALRGYVVQSAAGTGTSEANRVRMWGLNTLCDDGGFDYAYCINELDFNFSGLSPKVVGVSVGGVGTSASLDAGSVGYNVASLGTPKWPVGFGTADGSSTVGFAMGTLNTGSNTPSQTMQWWARNSGGTTQRGFLYTDADGNTVLGAGASASPVYLALLGNGRLTLPYEGATLNGNLLFGSAGAYDIGDATNYFQTAFGENLDLAPAGVTGNYANIRKLNIFDKNGGTSFYDIQVQATTTVDNFVIRDKAGTEVLRLDRTISSTPIDRAILDMSLVPKTDNARDLGGSGEDWKDIYFEGSLIHNGNTIINSSRQWALPTLLFSSDGTQAIGAASANRPGAVHVSGAGGGVMVYNGSVLRMLVTPPYLSLYNNSSTEVIRLDSNSGDAIFAGAITVASCSGCGSGSLPVTDTTGISKGSSDATKIVRFEVDGFTTGTTRVLTPPNADITIAGINLAQTWTATQTFASGATSIDTSGNVTASDFFAQGYNSSDGTYTRFAYNNPGAGSDTGSALVVRNSSGTSVMTLSYSGTLSAVQFSASSQMYTTGNIDGGTFSVAGNPGGSIATTCPSGQAIKSINVLFGLFLSASCGAP